MQPALQGPRILGELSPRVLIEFSRSVSGFKLIDAFHEPMDIDLTGQQQLLFLKLGEISGGRRRRLSPSALNRAIAGALEIDSPDFRYLELDIRVDVPEAERLRLGVLCSLRWFFDQVVVVTGEAGRRRHQADCDSRSAGR